MLHKISTVLLFLSSAAFVGPFILAGLGYGGEAFAQGGWVYSLMAFPFVLSFGLLFMVSKKK